MLRCILTHYSEINSALSSRTSIVWAAVYLFDVQVLGIHGASWR